MAEQTDEKLSRRAEVFRSKLIEEFQLLDCLSEQGHLKTPMYSSSNIIEDPALLERLLVETPMQMVKFKAYKRDGAPPSIDRRLTRVRNKNRMPLGAWAKWLVEHDWFQKFLMILIFFDAISMAITGELPDDTSAAIVTVKLLLNFLDSFTLILFSIEIALKWIDNFTAFWKSGWNIFDFFVTFLSAVPHLIMIGLGDRVSAMSTIIKQLSVFRILRSLRMISRFDGLRIIILTALRAVKSMVFITLLLITVAYIFAVVGVIFFGSASRSPGDEASRFTNLIDAMIALFQLFTLDHWYDIYNNLSAVAGVTFTCAYILLWVWVGSFVFRNLFVGIMVNNFQSISFSVKQQQECVEEHIELARKMEELDHEINKQENKLQNVRKSIFHSQSQDTVESNLTSEPRTINDCLLAFSDNITSQSREDMISQHLSQLSHMMKVEEQTAEGWDEMVHENLKALAANPVQTLWPRDSLFKYYQLLEQLQENVEEYEELQKLAVQCLLKLQDSKA